MANFQKQIKYTSPQIQIQNEILSIMGLHVARFLGSPYHFWRPSYGPVYTGIVLQYVYSTE